MRVYLEWHSNVSSEDPRRSVIAADPPVQQLPIPTVIGLTHTAAPWATSSRASMLSFVHASSSPVKSFGPRYASRLVYSGYLMPPPSPSIASSLGTPMSTDDEASLPIAPTTATEHHQPPKIVTAASVHITHYPHCGAHGTHGSISASTSASMMDLSIPLATRSITPP
ncbi:hypothetical protein BD410DRAFT_797038 [Rickenella mellea]|uniref:Uncharacterized protein n=1 Tax=Rickenella mellea TaxID=50990 RepID=A0A4Y7PJC4_9AGAM|nr:hypothetical protein BD410DRAFT_797038 [Rickenella mellea]